MSKEKSQLNTAVKTILKRYWWILLICLLAPIAINYALLIPAFGPVVGTNLDWLAFFGSYIAAIIPALGAFIILFIQRNDNHEQNERNRRLQINVLKYQQEMQWLNNTKGILIDFAFSVSENELRDILNQMNRSLDVSQQLKLLIRNVGYNQARVKCMFKNPNADHYRDYISANAKVYKKYNEILMDLQHLNILFLTTDKTRQKSLLDLYEKSDDTSDYLKSLIKGSASKEAFLNNGVFKASSPIVDSADGLFEEMIGVSLIYIEVEEARINRLLDISESLSRSYI